MIKVIKRDGRKVEFDKSKIKNAVLKAFEEVDGEITPEAKVKACEVRGTRCRRRARVLRHRAR